VDLMYGYALSLSTDRGHWTEVISWHATIGPVLLNNLAYIHHWRVTHLGISSELSVALHLYEQAGETIHQLGIRGSTS
jgi:hypothetical protein